MRSDDCLKRLSLRIACQLLGIELSQSLHHSRRASDGVLIEVQPQALTITQRRVICLQIAHCLSWFKHGGSAPESTPHARRDPQFPRDIRSPEPNPAGLSGTVPEP